MMLAAIPAAAAAVSTGGVDLTQFLQFGLLGLIFVCIILKKFIVPEWSLRQLEDQHLSEMKLKDEQVTSLKADKQELKEALDALQELTRTEIIPALVRANQLSQEYVAELAGRRRHEVSDSRRANG
jgi:predicted XRE-type DNA-binding protein